MNNQADIIEQRPHPRKKTAEPRPDYEVIQPGPNSPSVVDVSKSMLAKITTNSNGIIDSLIKQAATGHYQAAQYLLSEMNRLGEALKNSDQPSVVEILRPVLERLKAKQIAEGKISDPDARAACDDDREIELQSEHTFVPATLTDSPPTLYH
jgi:hypothetical protein